MRRKDHTPTCYVILNQKRPTTSGWERTFSQGDLVCLGQKGIKRVNRSIVSHLSMAQWLRKNHDFLKVLAKCTPAQRKAILKVADEALVKTICECVLNILKETVPLSKLGKRKLLANTKSLIALAEKSTLLTKKKRILVQHGGNFQRDIHIGWSSDIHSGNLENIK